MGKPYPDHEDEASDRYERLEELLQQTLALASEIAEDAGRALPGERIIVHRRSNSDPVGSQPSGAHRQDIRRSLLERRNALKLDDSEDSPAHSPSPASSVQEPFSPDPVAVSLDAVVEKGRTSDNDLCVLDNVSATSAAGRFAEPSSNRSSVLSTDEGQFGLAAQTSLPQLIPNENSPKRLQRPSFPQRNTSMLVHNSQESSVGASMETVLAPQIKQNARTERSERRMTPAPEFLLRSPAHYRPPISDQNSDIAAEKLQKSDECQEGHTVAHNYSYRPKWHVRILPVASSRGRGRGSTTRSSPTLMKFEAVFPFKASAEGNVMPSLSYNGESSFFIIGQPPVDSSPESPRPQTVGEETSVDHEKTLQDLIDEWEYDAVAPGVEDKKL